MPGFKPASTFAGFIHPNQGSILIAEMPAAAYDQISQGFGNLEVAKTKFAKANVVIDRVEEIAATDGEKVPLLFGSAAKDDTRYDKWIALFKGPPTVLITVTSPRANRLSRAQVQAMLGSVSIRRQPTLADKLAALPFSATAAPPFRILDSFAGAALGMTVGEKDVDPGRRQPQVIIAFEPGLIAEPAELERNNIPPHSLGNPRIESREKTNFAGMDGLLLNGSCDGQRRFLQYVAVTGESKLMTLVYVAPETDFDRFRPAAEAIARTVVLKQNQ